MDALRRGLCGLMVLGIAACDVRTNISDSLDEAAMPQATVGADGLRRLTAEQYNNTIHDLFSRAGVESVVFPFELDVDGFDNNTAVNTATPTLVETYFQAGFTVASTVAAVAENILDCDPISTACAKNYLLATARRAWRRELSDDERRALALQFDQDANQVEWRGALELGLAYVLQAPEFLYFPELGNGEVAGHGSRFELSSYEVASRLSYLIWNSMPDDHLLALAERDRLRNRDDVIDEAWRMLADRKAQRGVLGFYKQLLDLGKIGTTSLDFSVYLTEFEGDAGADYLHQILQPAMRFEPEIFVIDEIFRGSGTLRGLLTSSSSYLTPALAELYGVEIDEASSDAVHWHSEFSETLDTIYEETFYKTQLNPNQRSGVLTMLGFLNSHSKLTHPSPVLRGVFVQERFLCAPPPPPPGDVPALEETNNGQEPRTNRERYSNHTTNPMCASCHKSIDGIGFTFENYDGLGSWRDQDNGYPVDASGELMYTDVNGPVPNAVALTQSLAQSKTVHACHVKQWFRYAFGRTDTSVDHRYLESMGEGFWESGGDIAQLIVNIAGSKAFLTRKGAL